MADLFTKITAESAGESPYEFGSVLTETDNTFAPSTEQAYAGSYSYKAYYGGTNDLNGARTIFTDQDEVLITKRIWIDSGFNLSADSQSHPILSVCDGSTVLTQLSLRRTTTVADRWRVSGQDLTTTYSTTNYATGAWIKVQIYSKIGTSGNGIVRIWIDDSLIFEDTGVVNESYLIDRILVGNYLGGNTPVSGSILYYDEIEGIDTYTSGYTVTYDGNTNTGGSVPTDASSPYDTKEEVTVLSNSGSLVKTGYSFAGWNTAADGSGISYQYLDRFIMGAANVTLYAQWKVNIPSYPAKTIVAGGQGTRADASDNNGGCFSSDSDYASFQGANGGSLYTVIECSYDTDTGKITKAASFATGLEGVWVNVKEGGAGAWVEKRYWIHASDANSITIGAGLGSNADVDVWVGGALKTLEEMLAEAAEASGGFDSGHNAEFDIKYGTSIVKIDYPDGSLELSNGDTATLDVPAGGAGCLINGGLINAI